AVSLSCWLKSTKGKKLWENSAPKTLRVFPQHYYCFDIEKDRTKNQITFLHGTLDIHIAVDRAARTHPTFAAPFILRNIPTGRDSDPTYRYAVIVLRHEVFSRSETLAVFD